MTIINQMLNLKQIQAFILVVRLEEGKERRAL